MLVHSEPHVPRLYAFGRNAYPAFPRSSYHTLFSSLFPFGAPFLSPSLPPLLSFALRSLPSQQTKRLACPHALYALLPRVMGTVQKQHMNIVLWFGFLTVSFVVFSLFSDGDFSFLMVR